MRPAPRILILVLASQEEPWRSIERDGQRQTWALESNSANVTTRFYYGRTYGLERGVLRFLPGILQRLGLEDLRTGLLQRAGRRTAGRAVREAGDRIYTDVPETYLTIGAKTMAVFRHVLEEHEFDYLFRTNTSSYVNVSGLQRLCASLGQSETFYGGHLIEINAENFASGSGILLSRKAIEAIADDSKFEFFVPDDIGIGRSMRRNGVPARDVPWVRVHSPKDVLALRRSEIDGAHYFRCKSEGPRSEDIASMRALHSRIAGARTAQGPTLETS